MNGKRGGASSTWHLGLVLYVRFPDVLVASMEEIKYRTVVRVSDACPCGSTALAGH